MSWLNPIPKSELGEVGRVYYFNYEVIFTDNGSGERETWCRSQPFTLNPEAGKNIEQVLHKSTEIPGDLRAQLLSKRKAESILTNGNVIKIWIADEKAPDGLWGPQDRRQPQMRSNGLIY